MILLGSDPLSRFLNRASGRRFQWGEFDCLLWLADWIAERTGHDPAAELRGSYSTMLEAAKIVRGAGGMVGLVDSRLKPLSAVRASYGERGAIAVVKVGGEGGKHFGDLAGAILLGGSVALLCQAGLILPKRDELELVAAWSV